MTRAAAAYFRDVLARGSRSFRLASRLLPPGCRVSRQVGSRSLERFAGVLEMDAHEWIGRIALPAANGLSLASQGLFFGPTTGCTSDGAFVGTTSLLGLPIVFRWSDAELGVLRLGLPGCVLPGL